MYAPPPAYGLVLIRPASAYWLIPITFAVITHS
jgi:hypothetical protein